MRSVRDLAVRGKLVFVRVDFNVPLNDAGEITDDNRIKAALNTIEYLMQKGARVVLASHLGRPKGKITPEFRLKPVAKRLGEYLGVEVQYVEDCVGEQAESAKAALQNGEVLLLENLRFYPNEETNDMHFAERLAEGIDVYVAEGFGAIHRAHASTHALPSIIFDKGAGFLIQEELDALKRLTQNPDKPFVVVVGGVKISDKVDVIRRLAPLADVVLVGGGVANTFMAGLGKPVGASVVESDSVSSDQAGVSYVDVARDIYNECGGEVDMDVRLPDGGVLHRVQLPLDFVAAASLDAGAETRVIAAGEPVPDGWMFLDIGPATQQLYADVLRQANTAFWNGPMGLFEQDAYRAGSQAVAQALADAEGYSVLGGGDTESVVSVCGLSGRYSHSSTGGGASLNFLAGKELPGLAALE